MRDRTEVKLRRHTHTASSGAWFMPQFDYSKFNNSIRE